MPGSASPGAEASPAAEAAPAVAEGAPAVSAGSPACAEVSPVVGEASLAVVAGSAAGAAVSPEVAEASAVEGAALVVGAESVEVAEGWLLSAVGVDAGGSVGVAADSAAGASAGSGARPGSAAGSGVRPASGVGSGVLRRRRRQKPLGLVGTGRSGSPAPGQADPGSELAVPNLHQLLAWGQPRCPPTSTECPVGQRRSKVIVIPVWRRGRVASLRWWIRTVSSRRSLAVRGPRRVTGLTG